MKSAAIISEFNPFHNGHKYLIDCAKNNGAEIVIAIMSGNFVQRGETAVFSKFERATAALKNGIDLVVELPISFAMSGAQNFAFGGVNLANSLGAEMLVFGSESGNTKALKQTAERLKSDELNNVIKQYLKTGITYASAREKAFDDIYGESEVLNNPNDILGIEYITQIIENKYKIEPIAISRSGVLHDSDKPQGNFASASKIRECIKKNDNGFSKYVPNNLKDQYEELIKKGLYSDITALEKSILLKLRSLSAEQLRNIPDVSEGLENKIISAAKQSVTLKELYENIKSKRYTLARIKRIVLLAFLGITNEFYKQPIPYARVLGTTEKGIEFIKNGEFKIPVVLRAKELANNKLFLLETQATDTFNLSRHSPVCSGEDLTHKIIKV